MRSSLAALRRRCDIVPPPMTSGAPLGALIPKAPTSDARSRLDLFLRRSDRLLPGDPDRAAVEPLVKEAGERVYYRIRSAPAGDREADAAGRTLVLCVMAEPYEPGTLPFANSTLLYRELGVRTPRILEEVPELGAIALEDLGDDLLQIVALEGGAHVAALYDEATEIIARIQHQGARIAETPAASRFRAFAVRLDSALFLRELLFFAKHFLADCAGLRLRGRAARELESLFAALAEEAAGGPATLAHRDFHSRNLMARSAPSGACGAPGGQLHVIDHQDTRIGPRAYDLMSLVRDPYVAGERGSPMPFREPDLVLRFQDAVGIRGNPQELLAEFDAVALQRNLKALGTYGFQVSARDNDVYRRYIAPTLQMVRDNLERHSERADRRSLRSFLADLPDL